MNQIPLLLLLVLITGAFQVSAGPFTIEEDWNLEDFRTELDNFLENGCTTDIERLEILYSLIETADSRRISRVIETWYVRKEGERPSPSSLDRNLKYTLFIEETYRRIDRVKIDTAELLKRELAPVEGISGEIRRNLDSLSVLNMEMSEAVEKAESGFKEMILIRNGYLDLIDLQREVLRATLETRGPEAVLIAGAGVYSLDGNKNTFAAEAGLLYNLGIMDFGIMAQASPGLEIFGASLLLGWNIR